MQGIEVKFVENYDEAVFQDLVARNLQSDRVFVPAWDYQTIGDPSFDKKALGIRIGAFDGDRLIGLSWGEAHGKSRFVMHMSLVESAYRGRGIYTKMLDLMLEETKGFDEVDSHHHLFNNAIIATKLKRGFYIVGLDQTVILGPRVQLRYFHNQKLLEFMRFRVGLITDPRL
jgi:hypothetical protein